MSRVTAIRFGRHLAIGLFTACLAVAIGGSAHANLISQLTFSGAQWSNGSALSGDIVYQYDGSNNLTQVVSVDISITAGSGFPAFNLIYDVPGQTNTASTPGWDYNHPSNENYEFEISDSATGNVLMFLDMAGIGSTAALESSVSGGNYSSLTDGNVNGNVYSLSNRGTSLDEQVPEPSSLCLLIGGLLGIYLVRHASRPRPALMTLVAT